MHYMYNTHELVNKIVQSDTPEEIISSIRSEITDTEQEVHNLLVL
jgi:hypothetical protein